MKESRRCEGYLEAARRQEKYISTELVMGEDYHFVFGVPIHDDFFLNL